MTEIARRRHQSVADTICDLLADEEMQVAHVVHQSTEEDLRTILQHSSLMIGSDAVHFDGQVHPRVFATYPRILAEYVRRQRLLSLPEAIRKMLSSSRRTSGAEESRHRLGIGMVADLVLFDPETVQDNATYQQPKRHPSGMPYVFVNGRPVKDNHRHTGVLAGEVLVR